MKKYTWKREWDAKGIPAKTAVKVFEKVEKQYGKLTPETLVEYSKNPKSPLYKLFEWDNEHAADQWRKQQARLLINNVEVTIISDGKPVDIGAFEITMDEAGEKGYTNVSDVLTYDEVEYIKSNILQTLIQAKQKLKIYQRFDSVVFDLDSVIEKLSKIKTKEKELV